MTILASSLVTNRYDKGDYPGYATGTRTGTRNPSVFAVILGFAPTHVRVCNLSNGVEANHAVDSNLAITAYTGGTITSGTVDLGTTGSIAPYKVATTPVPVATINLGTSGTIVGGTLIGGTYTGGTVTGGTITGGTAIAGGTSGATYVGCTLTGGILTGFQLFAQVQGGTAGCIITNGVLTNCNAIGATFTGCTYTQGSVLIQGSGTVISSNANSLLTDVTGARTYVPAGITVNGSSFIVDPSIANLETADCDLIWEAWC